MSVRISQQQMRIFDILPRLQVGEEVKAFSSKGQTCRDRQQGVGEA